MRRSDIKEISYVELWLGNNVNLDLSKFSKRNNFGKFQNTINL